MIVINLPDGEKVFKWTPGDVCTVDMPEEIDGAGMSEHTFTVYYHVLGGQVVLEWSEGAVSYVQPQYVLPLPQTVIEGYIDVPSDCALEPRDWVDDLPMYHSVAVVSVSQKERKLDL